eukprot:Rmarinus@m.9770
MDDRAYHLIRPSDRHDGLMLDSEAVNRIAAIRGPVAVVSVVGTQRGGKSTLLNLLHSRKTHGFALGHYLDPQTTGLWFKIREHPRNPDLTVLLVDTEGLDSPHVPQWYNWCLSAVTLLISTYFMYQSKGSIDASAIDRLGAILKVASQLRGNSQSAPAQRAPKARVLSPNKDNEQGLASLEQLQNTRPGFLWLIRDHQLAMRKSPKEEMEEKLDDPLLQSLTQSFSTFDCFPLPRPVEKDELLRSVENMEFRDLTQDFRDEFVIFERMIFNLIQKGLHLSGPDLAQLLHHYVSALTTTASTRGFVRDLAALPTRRDLVARLAGERAVKAAKQTYEDFMRKILVKLPMPCKRLLQYHEQAMNVALDAFLSESVLEPDEFSLYKAEFEGYVCQWSDYDWTPEEVASSFAVQDSPAILHNLGGSSENALSVIAVRTRGLIGGVLHSLYRQNLDLSKQEGKRITDDAERQLRRVFLGIHEGKDSDEVGAVRKVALGETPLSGFYQRFLSDAASIWDSCSADEGSRLHTVVLLEQDIARRKHKLSLEVLSGLLESECALRVSGMATLSDQLHASSVKISEHEGILSDHGHWLTKVDECATKALARAEKFEKTQESSLKAVKEDLLSHQSETNTLIQQQARVLDEQSEVLVMHGETLDQVSARVDELDQDVASIKETLETRVKKVNDDASHHRHVLLEKIEKASNEASSGINNLETEISSVREKFEKRRETVDKRLGEIIHSHQENVKEICTELQHLESTLESKSKLLESKTNSLESKTNTFESKTGSLVAQTKLLESKSDSLSSKIGSLEENLQGLQDSLDERFEEVAESQEAGIEELRKYTEKNLSTHSDRLSNFERVVNEQRGELEEYWDELDAQGKALEGQKALVKRLESELASHNKQAAAAEEIASSSAESLTRMLCGAQEDVTSLKNDFASLSSRLDADGRASRQTAADFQASVSSVVADVKEVHSFSATVKSDMERRTSSLTDELSSLQVSVEKNSKSLSNTEQRIESLTDDAEARDEKVAALAKQVEELVSACIAATEAVETEKKRREAEVRELQSEIAQLRNASEEKHDGLERAVKDALERTAKVAIDQAVKVRDEVLQDCQQSIEAIAEETRVTTKSLIKESERQMRETIAEVELASSEAAKATQQAVQGWGASAQAVLACENSIDAIHKQFAKFQSEFASLQHEMKASHKSTASLPSAIQREFLRIVEDLPSPSPSPSHSFGGYGEETMESGAGMIYSGDDAESGDDGYERARRQEAIREALHNRVRGIAGEVMSQRMAALPPPATPHRSAGVESTDARSGENLSKDVVTTAQVEAMIVGKVDMSISSLEEKFNSKIRTTSDTITARVDTMVRQKATDLARDLEENVQRTTKSMLEETVEKATSAKIVSIRKEMEASLTATKAEISKHLTLEVMAGMSDVALSPKRALLGDKHADDDAMSLGTGGSIELTCGDSGTGCSLAAAVKSDFSKWVTFERRVLASLGRRIATVETSSKRKSADGPSGSEMANVTPRAQSLQSSPTEPHHSQGDLSPVHQRISRMEGRLCARIDSLSEDVSALDAIMRTQKERQHTTESRVSSLESRVNTLDGANARLGPKSHQRPLMMPVSPERSPRPLGDSNSYPQQQQSPLDDGDDPQRPSRIAILRRTADRTLSKPSMHPDSSEKENADINSLAWSGSPVDHDHRGDGTSGKGISGKVISSVGRPPAGAAGLLAQVKTEPDSTQQYTWQPHRSPRVTDYRIMLSGYGHERELKRRLLDSIRRLGGHYIDANMEDAIVPQVTHVVSPPGHRTLKTLGAQMHGGIWVVDTAWLLESAEMGGFLSEGPYGRRTDNPAIAGSRVYMTPSFKREQDSLNRLSMVTQLLRLGDVQLARRASEDVEVVLVGQEEAVPRGLAPSCIVLTYDDLCDVIAGVQELPDPLEDEVVARR